MIVQFRNPCFNIVLAIYCRQTKYNNHNLIMSVDVLVKVTNLTKTDFNIFADNMYVTVNPNCLGFHTCKLKLIAQ